MLLGSNMLHWYHMQTQLVMWAASPPPNNLANRGLLVVGPYKVIECGTGSVNIWAAGVWRGSELRHWTLSLPLMLSENKHSSRVFACCIRVEEVCLAARWATCNTLSSLMSHSAYWGSRMHHVCLICITLCSPTWNGTCEETNVVENCRAIRLDWKFV